MASVKLRMKYRDNRAVAMIASVQKTIFLRICDFVRSGAPGRGLARIIRVRSAVLYRLSYGSIFG